MVIPGIWLVAAVVVGILWLPKKRRTRSGVILWLIIVVTGAALWVNELIW